MSNAGAPVAGMRASNVPQQRQYWEDYFTYELDFATLTHLTTQNGQIQIQGDSDFKWTKAAFLADLALAAITSGAKIIPLVTVLIQDGGSGRNLMSATGVPVPSMFGTGELPFILPIPRIFRAKTTINFTVSNYSAATDYNLRLSLIGTKIFEGGPPQ